MRDKTHFEHLEKWAHYVRSGAGWKKLHSEFINAQFAKSQEFIEQLSRQKGGKEKLIKLYNIKNNKGYPKLLP